MNSRRNHYVASPDGQRFLVNAASDAQESITVLVNWTSRLASGPTGLALRLLAVLEVLGTWFLVLGPFLDLSPWSNWTKNQEPSDKGLTSSPASGFRAPAPAAP